jgi:hypothetical protein
VQDSNGNAVSGVVSYSSNVATFNPSSDLNTGTTYTITIGTGVKDSAGNALASSSSITFSPKWTRQLGTSGEESSTGIATDSSGNVYVTGQTQGDLDGNTNTGNRDLFVVKYNSSGAKQWTKQEGSSPSGVVPGGIATGSSGAVYATGSTLGNLDGNTHSGGTWDLYVIKFADNGTRQWTRQLGTSADDSASSIAIDSSENVFVTGQTSGDLDGNTSAGGVDLFLVKYNSSGVKQWTRQLGTSNFETGIGATADSSGNAFVTGYTYGSFVAGVGSGWDYYVLKYDTNGTQQWIEQSGGSGTDYGMSIKTDSSGNVYVTGMTEGSLDGNTNLGREDVFIVKYNSSGVRQWTRQFGTSSYDIGTDITIDINSKVYVTGYTRDSLDGNVHAGITDVFVVKYDTDGNKK